MFLAGERDYTVIKGGTGPLVYPAAHLYIYSALYYITDSGRNILLAQIIFGGVYLGSLSVVMACYRLAKVGTFPLHYMGMLYIRRSAAIEYSVRIPLG